MRGSWTYVGRKEGRRHVESFLFRLNPLHAFAAEELHKDGAVHYHLLLPATSDHSTEYANPWIDYYYIAIQWRVHSGGFTGISECTPGRILYAAKYIAKSEGWFVLY